MDLFDSLYETNSDRTPFETITYSIVGESWLQANGK
jgi:hypothetical protein